MKGKLPHTAYRWRQRTGCWSSKMDLFSLMQDQHDYKSFQEVPAMVIIDSNVWLTPDAHLPETARSTASLESLLVDYDGTQNKIWVAGGADFDNTRPGGGNLWYLFNNIGLWGNAAWKKDVRNGHHLYYRKSDQPKVDSFFKHARWRTDKDTLVDIESQYYCTLMTEYIWEGLDWVSDWVTRHFWRWIRRGAIISSPCLKFQSATRLNPRRKFIPIVQMTFNHVRGEYEVSSSTRYLLMEVYSAHLHNIGDDQLLDTVGIERNRYKEDNTSPLLPLAISNSIFSDYDTIADENTVKAASNSVVGEMDLLTTVAESVQTKSMIISFLQKCLGLLDAVKLARKGKIGQAKKKVYRVFRFDKKTSKSLQALKAGGNVWLEIRYGWRQIYFDARNMVNVIKATLSETMKRTYSWSSYFPGNEDNKADLGHMIGQQIIYDEPFTKAEVYAGLSLYTYKYYGKCQIRGGVGVDHLEDKWTTRLDAAVAHRNPAVLYWETLPFSFVVDWFVDIGAAIASAAVNPSRWTRQWQTVSLLPHSSNFEIEGEINDTDTLIQIFMNQIGISGLQLAQSQGQNPSANDCFMACCNAYNDEESVTAWTCQGHALVYLRQLPRNPRDLPNRIPLGVGLDWTRILDLASIVITKRKLR